MLIANATLADGRERDVRIEGERIAAVGELEGDPDVDASGKRLLPGAIDVHVHLRQPGFDHKETWETGSRSAAAGGVTTVVDQPNTDPPTTTGRAYDRKATLAEDSLVDYGINGGVIPDWDPETLFERPLFALGEVFLADSTGDMGIDDALFADAVDRAGAEGVLVTVHAEDADQFDGDVADRRPDDPDSWSAYRRAEAERAAIERACDVGSNRAASIHVAHTSTPEGIDAALEGGATCEVTPHHMLLSRKDLPDLGTFGRMNPPLRSERRREAVYERVVDGTVDVVATDHAPHTRAEKDAHVWDAPSGVPGVETMLPLLLAEVQRGPLTYERVVELTARNPADFFSIPGKGRIARGYDADLVLIDADATRPIRGEELHSRCEWTPFEEWAGVFPELTIRRGDVIYRREGDEELFGEADGTNVRA
jgi:dihydroorotase